MCPPACALTPPTTSPSSVPSPALHGLFMATGHGFKGITLCLVTGKNLAEFIVTGESSFALDAFAPSRLAKRA
jgi:glycine/D-amino acid oxidase-like deaminating enzyme